MLLWSVPLLGLAFCVLMLRTFSPQIYDVIILHMTSVWYLCTFDHIATQQNGTKREEKAEGQEAPFRLLDVGIGTASALLANKGRVLSQNLHVTGVDYDAAYISAARGNVARAGMSARVTLHCASIYEWESPDGQP